MIKISKKEQIEKLEKKIQNLHISLSKKYEKIKFQKLSINDLLKNNEELKEQLGGANRIIFKQIEEIKSLNDIIVIKNKSFKSEINKFNNIHEKQFKVAENEIKRLNHIIHYLESKIKIKVR